MNLVIVESPTKARKLSAFLGKNYSVESSVGHIADLPKKTLSIDIDNDFQPEYEVSADKKKVVSKLRSLAKNADLIYLASDPDREGEAIAWHTQHVIADKVKNKKFVRSVFHEITKEAVLNAINNPTDINMDLVDAQQARRVLDRLVGYKVSPVLWSKVKRGLSAGRVQSVALRLIVEREKEIKAFIPEEYWEVQAVLSSNNEEFITDVIKIDGQKYTPKTQSDVTPVITDLEDPSTTYQVTSVEKKEKKRANFPPFITSTLQQAAASRFGMTSKQTMSIAQALYEEGLITYHRTDSFNLNAKAVATARDYLTSRFGAPYVPDKPRFFSRKSKNAQEAHEAIRPTDIPKEHISATDFARFTSSHAKIYHLIWSRFMASQMESAIYDQTAVIIHATQKTTTYDLKANGSILKFDGWMKLFPNHEDKILPALSADQLLQFIKTLSEQKFTQPPPRYNDASIIKELESRGIGRPSTYASIISVIIERGYIERTDKRFFATPVGITVSDFLSQNLPKVVAYDFTAQMEEDLDNIASGEKKWQKVVGDFWWPFSKELTKVSDAAERMSIPAEPTDEPCPECHDQHGGMLEIKSSRFGKFFSCNRYPECKYARPFVKTMGVSCPVCGSKESGEVVERMGRFGKFYSCSRYPDCDWRGYRAPKAGETLTAKEWEEIKTARAAKAAKRKATMEAKKETKKPTKKKTAKKKK
ncbi:type I DNA topoisomerase [Microgenomates group bacterium]|nr:type I DNA topoisomerase [Microgenomates group bacterium]